MRKIGVLLLLLAVAGCWSVPSESQTKKTDQTKQQLRLRKKRNGKGILRRTIRNDSQGPFGKDGARRGWGLLVKY